MRNALALLLVFAIGVILTVWLSLYRADPQALVAAKPPAISPSAAVTEVPTPGQADAYVENWPSHAPTPEQVLYRQPRMVRDALAKLTPRVTGQPNLYVLSFAGDGAEDVFRNEAEYTPRLFSQRFGATTHTLILENNPASITTHPLASWSNLDHALAGLQQVMNPEQDILLLYLTSHGSEDHTLLVDMDPLPLDQIGAADLGRILAGHHFKWKVVVINACYSGGFVPALRGPGTLILAAARSDRSSFGCGSDSAVTYFGRAWLLHGLNRTADFIDAFKRARREIAAWEKQDKVVPSEPQIDIGAGIENQLLIWRRGISPGAEVNFAPTAPAAGADSPAIR